MRARLTRLSWFVGIWAASVVALGLVASILRLSLFGPRNAANRDGLVAHGEAGDAGAFRGC